MIDVNKRARGRGRPALPESERRVEVHFRLPRVTLDALDRYATRFEISRTEALEEAVMMLTRKARSR